MLRQHKARVWSVGPCLFCRSSTGGQLIRRTHEHMAVLKKFIVISRYISGHATGMTEGAPFGLRPGDIALRDFARSFEVLQYPSDVDALVIPHRVLGISEADLPALRVLHQGSEQAVYIEAELNAAFHSLSESRETFSFRRIDRLIACIRAALSRPPYSQSIRRAARLAQRGEIHTFIEENLERLDLSADLILPEFGLSRATLYRLFEPEGGVRKYIVDRRLFRALLDISTNGARRGKIQAAAKRWGFSSAANFNRSVRQAFGGTPGALFRPQRVASLANEPNPFEATGFSHDIWREFHE